ncbi:type II toxin-antitoxin system RelE/ParE family toxin [Escherichia coli]|uniref:type II toxin-antitoxin system RelE/ParE family toxin n=1 Tax=Escherichia coli TaxID=562 RepID=UPI00384D48A6
MEIFWTMLASQDRKRIREYIAEQNLVAAIELDERIGYSASSLAGLPYKGRNGRVEGTRELVIHPHFVLVYEVDSQWGKVYILRVFTSPGPRDSGESSLPHTALNNKRNQYV